MSGTDSRLYFVFGYRSTRGPFFVTNATELGAAINSARSAKRRFSRVEVHDIRENRVGDRVMDERGPRTGHLTKPAQECPCLCHKGAVVLHVVACCQRCDVTLTADPKHVCDDGWICGQHPGREWPHDDCAGPGMPCPVCNNAPGKPRLPSGWHSYARTDDEQP